MVYKLFDEKSSENGVAATEPNYHSQMNFINRLLFKKQKVYSSFRDNIQGVDLADTTKHALSEYNKGIKYLLCAIDLFRKYGWVFPLKDERGISIVNAFQ